MIDIKIRLISNFFPKIDKVSGWIKLDKNNMYIVNHLFSFNKPSPNLRVFLIVHCN